MYSGFGVKGQDDLWQIVFKTFWAQYRLQFQVKALPNFTHKWWMARVGTLSILGCGVKGHDELWYFVYKILSHETDYSYNQIIFKLRMCM